MNTRTTVIVGLIAAALGVYVVVFETERFGLRGETTREREQTHAHEPREAGERLLGDASLAAEAVQRIRIERGDREAVVFERDDDDAGRWMQVEPVRFAVEASAMMELIQAAEQLRSTRSVRVDDDAAGLDRMGLNPARGVVAFDGPGMERVELVLGRRAAAGRAFVAVGPASAGGQVEVVDDGLHRRALERSVRQMRSRSLASFEVGGVQRIRLAHADEAEIELTREAGRWRLVEPVAGRAGGEAARGLAAALTGVVIEEYVQDAPSRLSAFGLDEPRSVVEVEVVERVAAGEADGETGEQRRVYRLAIGSPTDLGESAHFAMLNDEPVVFTLGRADVERLAVGVDDVRDRKLTSIGRADVRGLTIDREADGQRLRLVRDGSGRAAWSFGGEGVGFELDRREMDRLLDAVFDAEAERFADAAALDEPLAAKVTMTVEARDEPEVLRVYGSAGGAELWVVRDDEAVAAVVERDSLERVLADAIDLRDRTVIDGRGPRVDAVTIQREGTHPASYELRRQQQAAADDETAAEIDAGDWDLDGYQASRVERAFEALVPLRAEAWAPDTAEPDEDDRVTVELALADGESERLTVYPQTRLAKLAGQELLFYVEPAVVSALTAELRQTLVLAAEVDEIASVRVGDVGVHRDRSGRFSVSGEGELDEQTAAVLWNTLSRLRGEYLLDAESAELPGEADRTLRVTLRDGAERTVEVWDRGDEGGLVRVNGDVVATVPDSVVEGLGY